MDTSFNPDQIFKSKTVIDFNGCHSNDDKGSDCGYCKGTKPNPGACQWGFSSYKMSVNDYQKLMDRGWRRSGTYYYKYDFERSCCQPYTIRLDTTEYKISHSQKQVMRRFNKFLLGEIDSNGNKVGPSKMQVDEETKEEQDKLAEQELRDVQRAQLASVLKDLVQQFIEKELLTQDGKIIEEIIEEISKTAIITKSKDRKLQDTKSWATNGLIKLFYKIKELNKESSKVGLKQFISQIKGIEILAVNQKDNNIILEENGYLVFVNMDKDEKAQIQKKNQSKKSKQNHAQNKNKEENKDPDGNQQLSNEDLFYQQYFKEFVPLKPGQKLQHKYTVQIVKAICNQECFEVFTKYQVYIHNDEDKSIQGYARFLCNNPLFDPKNEQEANFIPKKGADDEERGRIQKDEDVWPEYLGGYHMIHRIDGEIFAVGVLDYTPNVLSSVYLYYNPKYEFLSPGTFSAVREIEYSLRIQEAFNPDFKQYYMGLYFQDCQKSVYKGYYKPSQVLCPHTCNYVYLTDEVRDKIAREIKPLLSDKPKLKELQLSESQVNTLANNFRFCYRYRMMLKINDLNPDYEDLLKRTVKDLYLNMGLDVMLNTIFTI